jgi:hypothetical protein
VVDQKVAEGDYVTGDYAVVHNWEAGLDLFDRLEKNDTLRNSETWYQSFYTQADTAAIGDYVRVREQFNALLSLSDQELQSADTLRIAIQDNLKTMMEIEEDYGQATTEADSTALEAAWLDQNAKMSQYFMVWHQLAADIHLRIAVGLPALKQANAALPESIVPAANEKLMNTIQLKRILGKALNENQQSKLVTLAFLLPLGSGECGLSCAYGTAHVE